MCSCDEELEFLRAEVLRLRIALESSRLIATAVGLVMAQLTLDRRAAFAHLSQISQHTNTKVATLAYRLIAAAEDRAGRPHG